MSGTTTNGENDRLLHRMLFFTDAVFAIVLTLLALELKAPDAHDGESLRRDLAALSGHFVAFGLSFGVVAIFWAAHMNTLRRLSQFDWPTAWANLVFLVTLSVMPFFSAMVGEAEFGPAAWEFYCGELMATSLAVMGLWLVAARGRGRLLGGVTGRELIYRALRAAAPGLAFAFGYLAMRAGWEEASQLCWLLIPPLFLVARWLAGPRTLSAAPSAPAEPTP